MAENSPKPWEQQPNETAAQYKAFCIYRDAGPTRQAQATYRLTYGKHPASIAPGWFNEWVKRNRWHERCRAYDAHHQAIRHAEMEQATKKSANAWAARHEALREKVGGIAEQIAAQLDERVKAKKLKVFELEAAGRALKGTVDLHCSVAPAGAAKAEEQVAEFVVLTTDADVSRGKPDAQPGDLPEAQRHPDGPPEQSLPVQ